MLNYIKTEAIRIISHAFIKDKIIFAWDGMMDMSVLNNVSLK